MQSNQNILCFICNQFFPSTEIQNHIFKDKLSYEGKKKGSFKTSGRIRPSLQNNQRRINTNIRRFRQLQQFNREQISSQQFNQTQQHNELPRTSKHNVILLKSIKSL